jgi:toxin ParE1/3/4
MPGIGERRETIQTRLSGLRLWQVEGFEKHLIFYRLVKDEGVEIVRVLHGARDIDNVLDQDVPN